jgi:hypothetical protein
MSRRIESRAWVAQDIDNKCGYIERLNLDASLNFQPQFPGDRQSSKLEERVKEFGCTMR